MSRRFQVGDWVVYRKTKFSARPGPRAANVAPAPHGDLYSYTIDKFWVVDQIAEDGQLLLRTRRGKQHRVASNDLRLRHANFYERLRYRDRFVAIASERSAAQARSPDKPDCDHAKSSAV